MVTYSNLKITFEAEGRRNGRGRLEQFLIHHLCPTQVFPNGKPNIYEIANIC